MKKGFLNKLLFFTLVISNFLFETSFSYAASPDINAQSYILIDSETGGIISQKNADEQLYPASTTKIMTAIIALENGDLNQLMTASQAAVNDIGVDGMNIGIMADEQLRMEDLLNAMLVRSANETANIIAENISSSRSQFVELMNKRAKELGAINTHFVNPCGAHDPDHYTTAEDFAKIARHAMTIPAFKEIVAKQYYNMAPTNKHKEWNPLPATNKLLGRKSSYFSRVTGIKTGYTGEAGHNLISSAINEDGMELIAVVFGEKAPGSEKSIFNHSKELLEYGFQNYSMQNIAQGSQIAGNISVSGAKGNSSLDLVIKESLNCALPNDKSAWNLTKKEYISTSIKAPVKEGDILGYIEYENNGLPVGRVELIASRSVEKSMTATALDIIIRVLNTTAFKGVAIFLSVFIILRGILRRVSRSLRVRGRQENE